MSCGSNDANANNARRGRASEMGSCAKMGQEETNRRGLKRALELSSGSTVGYMVSRSIINDVIKNTVVKAEVSNAKFKWQCKNI